MQTLVIHDNEGFVLSSMSGTTELREPTGVPFLWADVPDNKRVVGVDISVTPHQVILEDIPPSEIDILRTDLDNAILELSMMIVTSGGQ